MKRIFLCGAALVALAACQPAVPDSGAGVGFDRMDAERRARDAQLQRGLPSAQPVQTTTLDAAVDQAERDADARARAANSGEAPLDASPANPAPGGNAGISNENDFNVVSNQRSIEADAARVRANASQYQVIAPTAVPSRSGKSGPNIVEYALSTSHPKGQAIYRRVGINLQSKSRRNCAGFASPDEAQIEFLRNGGPQKDRAALDPDGDGYACGWDPAPFRAVRGQAAAAAPVPVVPAGQISTE
ncbi:hypothetical protein [Pseudaestuariivita atlantica]|uniref:Excalibur calcium-binding domain-containing protein n=1 Tax=Pseudaestuariivita atlantica TaxID=1317121 RepID=A0A0L1JLD5_9RHOB|nr:hypothetical protein [Pseudaestuariivita atlantica]KNG92561.1 hypothetical protein ATO11_16160 [Pseudaestuariivita atlantica]